MPSNSKKPNSHTQNYIYYGKGITGYAHYKQDFDRNFDHRSGKGGNGGCLLAFFAPILFFALWAVLLAGAILLIYFFFIVIPDAVASAFSGIFRMIIPYITLFNL